MIFCAVHKNALKHDRKRKYPKRYRSHLAIPSPSSVSRKMPKKPKKMPYADNIPTPVIILRTTPGKKQMPRILLRMSPVLC